MDPPGSEESRSLTRSMRIAAIFVSIVLCLDLQTDNVEVRMRYGWLGLIRRYANKSCLPLG
jgi:hypothetical protein